MMPKAPLLASLPQIPKLTPFLVPGAKSIVVCGMSYKSDTGELWRELLAGDWLAMTPEEFRRRFAATLLSRAGLDILKMHTYREALLW